MRRTAIQIISILAAAALFLAVIVKHLGFLEYAANLNVLKHISIHTLAQNLLVTPSILILFAVSFYSTGKLIYDFLVREEINTGYEGAVFTALGMGAANYIFFVLGRFSLVYRSVVILYLAAGAALFLYSILRNKKKFTFPLPNSPVGKILLFVALLGLGYNAVAALSIPVSWDALAYQLTIPKFYAAARGFVEIPGMKLQQCLIGGEMLNTAAMVISNDRMPQLFSFLSEGLIIYLVIMLGKRYFGEFTAWASASLFAVTPAVLKTGGIAGNDLTLALFIFLAAVHFWKYITDGNRGCLYLSALFCGFAASTKLSGLAVPAFLIGAIIIYAYGKKIRPTTAQVLICITLFIAITGPVFYQKYTLSGNPLFPFLHQYINPADNDTLNMITRLNREIAATEGVEKSPMNFLLLPYNLIRHSPRFQDTPFYFVIPALLLLFIRVISRRKPDGKELFFSAFIIFYLAVWFFAGWQLWRHLLGIMPFMFLLVFEWLGNTKPRYLKAACGAMLTVNLLPFFQAGVNNELFAVFALPSIEAPGAAPRGRYLEKTLDHYAVYEYANKRLPPDSRVLLFREMRGYYLDVPYFWGDPNNQPEIAYDNYTDYRELKAKLEALNITHIIVNFNIYGPSETYYDRHTLGLMKSVIDKYAAPAYEANGVVLYSLKKS